MKPIRPIYRWGIYPALLMCLGLSLVGCKTMDEHRTATGAITGAVVGATAGALLHEDSVKGALIGGMAGAAIGGGIGYILEKQKESFDRIEDLEAEQTALTYAEPAEDRPRATAEGAATGVSEPAELHALHLTSNKLLFEEGSASVSPHGIAKLEEIAQVLNEYPDSEVMVNAHTSDEGDEASNLKLSKERAKNVQNQLVYFGVAESRIQALGHGSTQPVGPNDSPMGRLNNRRVEIYVVPHQ